MHMRCRLRRGSILASEADELDCVADQIEVGVDAEVIEALSAFETASKGRVGGAVDDLIGGGDDMEGGGEVEDGVGVTSARVEGQVLACAGWVGREILACSWWVGRKVLACSRWVVDLGEILTLVDGTAPDRGGK